MFGLRNKGKEPKCIIQILNPDGTFKGYLRNIEPFYRKVYTASKVKDAKKFPTLQEAQLAAGEMYNMSRGLYNPNIMWV